MIVYRGFKDILHKNINFHDIMQTEHVFGIGSCWAINKDFAQEYTEYGYKNFYYIFKAELHIDQILKIDATQFRESTYSLINLVNTYLELMEDNCEYNQIRFNHIKKNTPQYDLNNLDFSVLEHIRAKEGFNSEDRMFDVYGYFFVYNNKVCYSKDIEKPLRMALMRFIFKIMVTNN